MDLIVGIGGYAISDRGTDRILTFALSSCVAVTAYSPSRRVAGLIHLALPSPTTLEQSKSRPAYYVSSGVPFLLQKMNKAFGCSMSELKIGLYGGANSINSSDVFGIGRRNIQAVVAALNHMGLRIHTIEAGNTVSRSLLMDVATGAVMIKTQPLII